MKLTLKSKKLFKSIGAIAVASLLASSTIFITSCKNNTPQEPVNPNPPTPPNPVVPVETDLEKRVKEYNNLVLDITSSTSLTAEEDDKKVEIDDGKLKLTQDNSSKFIETETSGESFEYVFDGDGYTKNPYTGMLTAQTAKTALISSIDIDDWTAVDAQGKLTKTGYSAEFDKAEKTLVFASPEHTITIYDVGQTQVSMPKEKDPVQEGFKITEDNIEQVQANARKIVEELNIKVLGKGTVVRDIKEFYLTASDTIVDTIGVIYVGAENQTTKTETLAYIEAKLPRTSDITYEDIYKGTFTCSRFDATLNRLFMFDVNRNKEQSNKEVGDIIKAQALGKDFQNLDWTAHNLISGELTYDVHSVAGYDTQQQKLISYVYRIKKDYNTQPLKEVVEKYYVGKEPSQDTYTIAEQQEVVVSLANKKFLVVEEQSKQQNIENVG